jgi:hypothetical protein
MASSATWPTAASGANRRAWNREQREMVEQFARRFGVDLKHARKVAQFALELFHCLARLHQLAPVKGRLMEAAAYLRDVGHAISDAGHHKHSQYIVANADLGGFTDIERLRVAMLCRYHRKSMPGRAARRFHGPAPDHRRAITLLAPLLRIADALDRSREQRVERSSAQPGADRVITQAEGQPGHRAGEVGGRGRRGRVPAGLREIPDGREFTAVNKRIESWMSSPARFAEVSLDARLAKLMEQAERCAASPDADEVHDSAGVDPPVLASAAHLRSAC